MKRFPIAVALLFIAAGSVAATASLAREVRQALERAVVREREAVARYEAFARKADEEGYPGVAALFRAQARAEGTHAARFEAVLREHELAVPAEQPAAPNAGTTHDNLMAAVAVERAEPDGEYRAAVDACTNHGAPEIARIFDLTRDSEVEHGNLDMAAARNLESMRAPKTFYVCGKCGYTTDVKLPFCPACQHKAAPYAVE